MAKRKRSRKGYKILTCSCERQSYEVATDIDSVTCWRCINKRNKKFIEGIVGNREEKKQEREERKIEKKESPPVSKNPIDPKTGKPRRGRPPKNSTLS